MFKRRINFYKSPVKLLGVYFSNIPLSRVGEIRGSNVGGDEIERRTKEDGWECYSSRHVLLLGWIFAVL